MDNMKHKRTTKQILVDFDKFMNELDRLVSRNKNRADIDRIIREQFMKLTRSPLGRELKRIEFGLGEESTPTYKQKKSKKERTH